MKKKQYIKLFSHNDLDGFGAPNLFLTLQSELFKNIEFDLSTISAGNLDKKLSFWFKNADFSRYSDVYIMDMTPESEYSFNLLNQKFANHWRIFDHHESNANLRDKFITQQSFASNKNHSATSLVWEWIKTLPNFKLLDKKRSSQLDYLVELIRAYDTWDWQNDLTLPKDVKLASDELNQLFWFYPLNSSQKFIQDVFQTGWSTYRRNNELLISTLNNRRERYLERHLRTVETFSLNSKKFGVVYASDYKSEIAHELLYEFNVDVALVIDSHSISLRSNGKLDVAKFSAEYFSGGGHEDSAGGTLEINPVQIAEQSIIDFIKQKSQVEDTVNHSNENGSSLENQIDPKLAAKLKELFK